MKEVPGSAWLEEFSEEDFEFLRRFLLASGSLKDLAEQYGVSYPTIRLRLDRLIEKVKITDSTKDADPLERKVKLLVAEGKIDVSTGKQLLAAHRASKVSED